MARLGDICTVVSGTTPSSNVPEYWNGDINWITPAEMTEESGIIFETQRKITELAVKKSGLTPFPAGTVLFSSRAPIGKVGIAGAEMYCNQGFKNLICSDVIFNKYLYWFLIHKREYLNALGRGATFKEISKSLVEGIEIPLPPFETQQTIASLLDKVDALISLRKKQLQKLDDLVKSRFVEMFGDPKINPYNYLVASLGEHITFLTSGSRGWAKYCVEDGKEWFITIKNVKDCAISVENMQSINAPSGAEAERTRVQEGDLLISITADLGRTGVVTKHIAEHGAYINQHLTCIRLDMKVLNPLYVAYFMETPAGKEQFEAKNQSAVKAGLNFNSINSLRIIIPPIDKQNEFVTFVKHVDLSRLTIQNGLNKLELLKQSLMRKYFE